MQSLTTEDVLTALKGVVDPENNKDVVALGLIQGLSVKDGHVSFALEVAPAEGRAKEPLRLACEKAVLALKGARSVTAVLTAHRANAGPAPRRAGLNRQMQAEAAPRAGAPNAKDRTASKPSSRSPAAKAASANRRSPSISPSP